MYIRLIYHNIFIFKNGHLIEYSMFVRVKLKKLSIHDDIILNKLNI